MSADADSALRPSFDLDAPGRPFDEPWQAEAFALAVALNEAGHLAWSDWAKVFSAELAERQAGQASTALLRNDPASNAVYWRAWVAALETIVRDRGFAAPLQLGAHREAVRAYRRVGAGAGLFRNETAIGEPIDAPRDNQGRCAK